MISLGLTAREQELFNLSLVRSHSVKVRVYLMDLSHRHISDLTEFFVDGQVNVDATGDVITTPTRDATLTLLPTASLPFETFKFTIAPAYSAYLVKVFYGVRSELLDRWVWVPVFCGNVDGYNRTADAVNLTAKDKSIILMGTRSWKNQSFSKGTVKTSLLRSVLNSQGETMLDIPSWSDKTDKPMTLLDSTPVWEFVQKVAKGMSGGATLGYDPQGVLRLYKPSSSKKWTFQGGDDGCMLNQPEVNYNRGEDFFNSARLYGGTPAKAKKPIIAEYTAPRNHPLSPWSLARNGAPQYFAKVESDTQITTQKDADTYVKAHVDQALMGAIEVKLDSLVVPHLEPGDVCGLYSHSYHETFKLTRFSIPLNATGSMSVGYNSRVSKWWRRTAK